MRDKDRVELPGSHKEPLQGARAAGPVNSKEVIDVTVRIRPRPGSDLDRDLAALLSKPVSQRSFMTPEDMESKYGFDDEDLRKVEDFADQYQLSIVRKDRGQRSVVLRGTMSAMQRAFQTRLEMFHHDSGPFRGRSGTISVPAALANIVVGVHGLDDRPLQRKGRRLSRAKATNTGQSLAARYKFPANTDGTNQCIALIELGGGYRSAEVRRYLTALGIDKKPRFSAISVNGAHNTPSTADSDDGEVVLDMEVASAAAPGAQVAVYFGGNSDRDFVDAILGAVHDKTRKPSVISISWGSPEQAWTDQSRSAMDEAFKAAAMQGITVCVAAGDHGTNDVPRGPAAVRVDFPASSPYVLACGGTDIQGANEVVWNDGDGWATGGGISIKYPIPSWQAELNRQLSLDLQRPGRGVPDVSGAATNYDVLVDGEDVGSGGTSAVAPLWAALIVRLNQALGRRVGFVNPELYTNPSCFTDITGGNNAALGVAGYQSARGWDACTGLGVPNGEALKAKL